MSFIQCDSSKTTEGIIGAAIEVHKRIGPGILESTYHLCLQRELGLRKIPFESGVVLPLEYKGLHLGRAYVIDLLVNNEVVVELKCVSKLLPIHECQLMTYMRLGGIRTGLLINFKVPILKQRIRRILM
jgi:GxxExxY protein